MKPLKQPALNFSAYETPLKIQFVLKDALRNGPITLYVVAGIATLFFLLVIIGTLLSGDSLISVLSDVGFLFIFILIPVFAAFVAIKRALVRAKQIQRLRQFSTDNNFTFEYSTSTLGIPGMLFVDSNSESQVFTVVSGIYKNMPFSFGNACFITGSGKNRREAWYGVIQVQLNRAVPNVLLDSKKNNPWLGSNFASLKRNQRLELEGNFNNYFNLYVPAGYERDALYFITPELMALLIDKGANFDVELVDNKLFMYKSDTFALEHLSGVRSVFEMIDTLGGEFQENTHRYADANVGSRAANTIAKPGQRLKKSVPWLIVVVIVLFVILSFFN